MPDSRFFQSAGPFTLKQIAEQTGCVLHSASEGSISVTSVASLAEAGEGHLAFLSNKQYVKALENSKAAACILEKRYIDKAPAGVALLISDNPYAAYAKAATMLHPVETRKVLVSPNARIHENVRIGEDARIESFAYIGAGTEIGAGTVVQGTAYIDRNVVIGKNCHIGAGAYLANTIIGDNVIIHPGVKIGQDGFGFAFDQGKHIKVPQLGRVIIENDVEIGANSCIDRGAGPDTVIGAGTKIDNLVQIGHNVVTGKGCIIVSQVGISGSTKLGDYVVVGGQVGIAGHLEIGSGAQIAAQSGVMKDIPPKGIVGGSPAMPVKQWHRQSIALKNLIEKKGQ